MAEVHDRMPVILLPGSWDQWTDGGFEDALALCQTWAAPLTADHTNGRWVDGVPMAEKQGLI